MHSPTTLEAFADCPRKWAWRKLEGVEVPPGPYLAFGVAMHGHLERYLRDGEPIDLTTPEGRTAMAGLHYLPPPGTARIEEHWVLEIEGLTFHGYIDASAPGLVIDHKSTSDLKWAKTPLELVSNLQAALYAHAMMVAQGAETITLRWIYYQRERKGTKPKARAVEALVSRAMIAPTLARAVALAREIEELTARKSRALDLIPNTDHCEAYGGCAYKTHCNITPDERLHAIMNQSHQSFIADVTAKLGGGQNGWQKSADGAWALNPATNTWEPTAPKAPPPPPPPAQAAPPPPPPPAINPPPVGAAPPPPPAQAAPPPPSTEAPKRGRPVGSKNKPSASDLEKALARALRAAADELDGGDT